MHREQVQIVHAPATHALTPVKTLAEMTEDELFISLRKRTRGLRVMREIAREGLSEIVLLIAVHNYTIRRVVARYGVIGPAGDALYEAIVDEVTCFTLKNIRLGII